jgi:hypothetical protein
VFEAAVGGVVVFAEVAALGFAVNEVGDEQPPVLLAAAATKDTSETVKDAELWVKIVEGEDEGGLACYRSWKSVKRWFSQIIARQNPEELVGKETLAEEGATSEAEAPAEVDAALAVAGTELAGPAEGEASVGKELPTPSKEEALVEAKSAPTVDEEEAAAGGAKGGAKVIIKPHHHKEVFVAKGKEDALVTKNLVPRENVRGADQGGDSRPVRWVVSGRRAGGAGVRADMCGVRDFGFGDWDSQGRGSAVGLQMRFGNCWMYMSKKSTSWFYIRIQYMVLKLGLC